MRSRRLKRMTRTCVLAILEARKNGKNREENQSNFRLDLFMRNTLIVVDQNYRYGKDGLVSLPFDLHCSFLPLERSPV